MTDFAAYARVWKICAIPRGKKSPDYAKWNVNPLPLEAAGGIDGAGLLHALSGTCALDVDDASRAAPWLAERGVDLESLLDAPDAVQISSGRYGRAKLLYRLTRPLRTLKPAGSGLELRCATANGLSVQDVLPPSVHPDTKKPYEWVLNDLIDGHWSRLPAIPAALLSLWRELAEPIVSTPLPEQAEAPAVDLAALRKALFRHSPDAEYNEWLRLGMQLHQGTGGAQEGFDIWAEWSKGIKRAPYPGDEKLKSHWLSFNSGGGKRLATAAALVAELPAEAEEFPIETGEPEAGTPTSAELEEEQEAQTRKEKMDFLHKRLVYVLSAERYFDCERQKLIGTDNALEHIFGHLFRGTPIAKILKKSGSKKYVDSMGFHPGEGVIFHNGADSYANGYRNRLPAPIEPSALELEKIEWLFARIDDPIYRKWLKQFYAHLVQRPGVKIKAAPLIWSDTQGNGKSTLVQKIPSLLVGAEYSKEVNSGLLNSDFNDYLLNAWHINLTEFRAGSRGEREAISKKVENWIADDVVSVHPKGLAAYTMPNHFFVTGSSNAEDAAAVTNSDRKWGVHEMHAPQFTEAEQRWIYQEFLLTPRASAVLRHYFLNTDLAGFVASAKAPETQARKEMADASMASDVELLTVAFEQQTEPLANDIVLTQEVTEYVHRHCPAKPSAHRVGRILARKPFNGKATQFWHGTRSYRGVILRNHAKWESATGAQKMACVTGDDAGLNVDVDDLLA